MSGREKPARLGRGLAALLGDREEAGSGLLSVPIASLSPGPFQPRRAMEPEALEELSVSIRAHGVLQPILVRADPRSPGRFEIIAGERRWRAAQMAGLHEIPVHRRDFDDRDAMAAALIENLQRQDLNAIEEAEGLRRLTTEFGLTQELLARSVGKSRSHVANMLRLLALPEAVQHDVRAGSLTAGHARALLSHPDPRSAALQVLARGLNVRQTEALARPTPRRPVASASGPALFETEDLAARLGHRLGLRVRVTFDGEGGTVVLSYRSVEQLEGLIALLAPGIQD